MVLPLLGLLALGAAETFGPGLQNRRKRIAGDYYGEATAGVDPNDPNAMRQALGMGGLLSGSEVQGDLRTGFEGEQTRAQSDLNSRRSAGSAAASLQQRIKEFDYQVASQEAQAAQARASDMWTVENYGTDTEKGLLSNPFITPQASDEIAAKTRERAMQTIDTAPIIESYREAALKPTQRIDKGNQILELLPDASRFDSWIQDPANRTARATAERMGFELRQDWIDEQIAMGREPSEALQERAERLFPTDLGTWDSRQVLEKNLRVYMNQQQKERERLQVDFQSRLNGNPLNILNTYDTRIPGQVSAGEVIPD